jgi:YVTN family beta-propeller protein
VATAAAAVVAASCGGGDNEAQGTGSPSPSSSTTFTPAELEDFQADADASITVPGFPDFMTFAAGQVWVGNETAVDRIDAATDEVIGNTDGPSACTVFGSGFGSVWVPSCSDNRVYRLEQNTGRIVSKIKVSKVVGESGSAVGEGGVWLITGTDEVSRIDAKTHEVRSFKVAFSVGAVAVGFGSVWATIWEDGTVQRIDPATGEVVATISVGQGPLWISIGEDSVWVSNQGSGTVSRIDPETDTSVAEIDIGGPYEGGDIAAGDGVVWAATGNGPLTVIDQATNEVIQQWEFHGADAIALGDGSAWISDHDLQTVYRYTLP